MCPRNFTLLSVFCGVVGLSRFVGLFSFPPFPPGSVSLLLFGIGIRVGGYVRVRAISMS